MFTKMTHGRAFLSAAAFRIFSTKNILKGYSSGQLVCVRNTIIPIKHKVGCELIRQRNQTQINKNNIRKNSKIVNREYKVGYKVMLNNNDA